MSEQSANPISLWVSFEEPESIHMVLQGPTLVAYYDWKNSESDEDYEAFMEALAEQAEDHIAQWTRIRDWNFSFGSGR